MYIAILTVASLFEVAMGNNYMRHPTSYNKYYIINCITGADLGFSERGG